MSLRSYPSVVLPAVGLPLCCGSEVSVGDDADLQRTGAFQRVALAPAVRVTGAPGPTVDAWPPNAVTTLAVSSDFAAVTSKLSFMAPGEDLGTGSGKVKERKNWQQSSSLAFTN